MKIPEALQQKPDYQACVSFHGHTCMGLTLGYLAAQLALQELREKRAIDEELLCITETDACCCDAIQVLTGCTFGKGNLLWRDLGKFAFTFASRTSGSGIRLVLRPGIMDPPEDERLLAERIGAGSATPEEVAACDSRLEERSRRLFEAGPEAFFTVSEISLSLPDKARIAPSKPCAGCGEAVMITKLQEQDGALFCRDCRPMTPGG